eukprot:5059126-Amphidinium_carterae.1
MSVMMSVFSGKHLSRSVIILAGTVKHFHFKTVQGAHSSRAATASVPAAAARRKMLFAVRTSPRYHYGQVLSLDPRTECF